MYVIYIVHILTCISPFTPGDFAKNHALDTIILLRAKSYHKAVYSSYTSRPSDPDAKHLRLQSSGMRRKQNFEIFTFLLFFCFSFLILFSLAGHLVGFILVGKVFRKAFRILGLDERKGMWVVEQNFHGNFQVNVTWVFAFFSSVLDLILPILVWFERSLKSAIVSGQSCP